MNQKDLNRLEELNRRFSGFKIVGENTMPERVVEDIRCTDTIIIKFN